MTVEDFRKKRREFENAAVFTDGDIQDWLDMALLMLNADRWLDWLDKGTELFVAHNLVLEAYNRMGSDNGGLPGLNRGVIASEGADGTSVAYNVDAGIVADAGHWNLTTYGTRFMQMVKLVGMGPLQSC